MDKQLNMLIVIEILNLTESIKEKKQTFNGGAVDFLSRFYFVEHQRT